MIIFYLITLLGCFLIFYHHILWVKMMEYINNKIVNPYQYKKNKSENIPAKFNIELIVPIYNESKYIRDKLNNILELSYPRELLTVSLHFDGCTDDSYQIAKEFIQTDMFQDININLYNHLHNKGKLYIINNAIKRSKADIIALSDCSALIKNNAFNLAENHFHNNNIGCVCASYKILNFFKKGEKKYWQFQNKIKKLESNTGNAIGAHGALYFIRKKLYKEINSNIINDDFIIPMNIVLKGYRSVYDDKIICYEIEKNNNLLDWGRRKRIAAGNLQQVIYLKELLLPKFGYTAINFLSGKVLRVFMPFILLITFISSIISAVYNPIFLILLLPQVLIYSMFIICVLKPKLTKYKIIDICHYFVIGNISSMLGVIEYLIIQKISWNVNNNSKNHA